MCYVCMMLSYIENPSRLAQDVVQLVSHSVSTTLLHRLCLGMYFCTKIIVLLHAKKKKERKVLHASSQSIAGRFSVLIEYTINMFYS